MSEPSEPTPTPSLGREVIRLAPLRLTAADVFRLACRRWWIVLTAALLALAGTSIYYCEVTRWYEAEVMLLPRPGGEGAGAAAALIGDLPFGLLPSHNEAARIESILHSRSVTDGVIERFALLERYEVGTIEKARKRLWGHCTTEVDKKPKAVHLRCEDEEPAVARDMADTFATLADAGFRRVAAATVREERAFLEERLAAATRDLEASAQAIQRFQEENAILDLPTQGEAMIAGLAALEGKVISSRLDLAYARSFASSRESTVRQLQARIGAISAELRALEQERDATAAGPPTGRAATEGSRLFPSALAVPRLRAELDALLREHDVRQTLFLQLSRRDEALKADDGGYVAGFIVYDHARLPTRHIRPTARCLPTSILAGACLGLLVIVLRRRDPRRPA
jgi:uncharacterized protein involved in exopolysaccharide biosynthesis